MSRLCWQARLRQALRSPSSAPRVAVVGVGHELNGDDAAGIAVARSLAGLPAPHNRLLVIDAGPAPENTTGLLRRFGPDLVLLVDAAQMGEPPGAIRWLDWRETDGISASTHTLPLHLLARYLVTELGCDVALLGIQPAANTLDAPLSPAVSRAVASIVADLSAALVPA